MGYLNPIMGTVGHPDQDNIVTEDEHPIAELLCKMLMVGRSDNIL